MGGLLSGKGATKYSRPGVPARESLPATARLAQRQAGLGGGEQRAAERAADPAGVRRPRLKFWRAAWGAGAAWSEAHQ